MTCRPVSITSWKSFHAAGLETVVRDLAGPHRSVVGGATVGINGVGEAVAVGITGVGGTDVLVASTTGIVVTVGEAGWGDIAGGAPLDGS